MSGDMQDIYPRLTRSDEKDPAIWKPRGWTGSFYKLFNSMRFVRKELHLSADISIVQTELLQGHIKVGGVIDPGRLSIGFYQSSQRVRLSGRALSDDRMAISYNGCKWDAVSQSPAFGIAIHFSPALTKRIVSQHTHSILMGDAQKETGDRLSQVSAISPAGEELRAAMRSSIHLVEEAGEDIDDKMVFAWMSEDLVSLTSSLMDEATEDAHISITLGETVRYDVAREIENLLWKDPVGQDENIASLHGMARYFDCSPRQIQMALQENFGVGFTALKRSIRLQQVKTALDGGAAYVDVTSVAMDHGFGHIGRFSSYYKEMFGELPSKSLRARKIAGAGRD